MEKEPFDPDGALDRQREFSRRILEGDLIQEKELQELAGLIVRLDEYLEEGGQLPRAWVRRI